MSTKANTMPSGIPYIIGNEAAERYSFYGMKAILFIFLTEYIRNASGQLDVLSGPSAKFWFHLFVFSAYIISFAGAFLSDIFLGKYRTIIYLSIVYVIGHFVLALFETHTGFFVGCGLIAIGAGGIKPCVSAHVGDQFEDHNKHMLEKIFLWFYLSINIGATIAYLTAEPILRNEYLTERGINATVAFGLPGILMLIALIIFWLGRKHFISIKPAGWKLYRQELFSAKGAKIVLKLIPLYIFLAVFWSLFDQTGSSWVEQAQSDLMNKTVNLGFFSFDFLPSQIGFINPLCILIFIPLCAVVIYPFLRNVMNLTYMKKIWIGLFIMVLSFAIISWVQTNMDNGIAMSIGWQILAYVLLTMAEVFVSITALEFSYTQAPNSMKSFVMSFYLVAVAIGNLFTSLINLFIQNADGTSKLAGASYFWFFTALMLVTAVLFTIMVLKYKETAYIQSRANAEEF